MTIVVGAAGLVAATFLWLLHFVLTKEYPDWGRRLARGLIAVAAMGVSKVEREDLREEWEAELAVIPEDTDGQATGLAFALWLVARYGAVGVSRSMWAWVRHRALRPRRPPVETSPDAVGAALQSVAVTGAPFAALPVEMEGVGLSLADLFDPVRPEVNDFVRVRSDGRRWIIVRGDQVPVWCLPYAYLLGIPEKTRSEDQDPGPPDS